MKKLTTQVQETTLVLGALYFILYLSACAVKPASDLDNPEYHHKAGMRHVEMGQYQDAIRSFQRAIDLDKKFALAYAGMGIANANLNNKKEAKKNVSKAESLGSKDADVLALCARVWIDLRSQEKKWHKDANQRFWIPTTMALPFGILYPFTDTEDTMKWAFAKMKDIPKKEQKNYPDGKGNFYDKMYDTENANIYDEFFEGLLELNTMAKSLEINTSEEKKINLPKMKKVK